MKDKSVHTSKFVSIILVCIISLINWKGVIADVYSMESESQINTILEEAIKDTEKALKNAKQGNEELTTLHIIEALKRYKKIDNLELTSKLRSTRNKLKSARKNMKRGEAEMAADDLNEVLDYTKDIVCCPSY